MWWGPLWSPPRLAKGPPKTARIAKVEQFLDFFLFSMELLDFWYNYCHLVLVNALQLQYKAQGLQGPILGAPGAHQRGPWDSKMSSYYHVGFPIVL